MNDCLANIANNLRRSLESRNLHHAILISGRIGIGKIDFSRNFIGKILGISSDKKLDHHPDFKLIEKPSGKKNISVDQVRAITNFFQSTSSQGSSKVVLINSIENFNVSSSNAILKILEEPNSNCYLIMTCNNLSKIIPTIKSRCQIYKVKNLSFEEFKNEFYKIRPDFLPRLPDNELQKLSLLTENSPKLAVKNGDEFLAIFDIVIRSIEKRCISDIDIKTICNSDFSYFITTYCAFLSLLIGMQNNKTIYSLSESEQKNIKKICQKLGTDKILTIYDDTHNSFSKVNNIYLDQKLIVINSINRILQT